MSAHLRLVAPCHKNRSVPTRPANAELRTREYLTPKEVEKLIKTARDGRYGLSRLMSQLLSPAQWRILARFEMGGPKPIPQVFRRAGRPVCGLVRPPHRPEFRETSERVCAPVQSGDAVGANRYRFRAWTMVLARTGNNHHHSHTRAACRLDFLCRRHGTSPS
jgi:hypothetical protein